MNIKLSFGVRNGNEDTELLCCTEAEVSIGLLTAGTARLTFPDLRRYCLLVGRYSSVEIARHYGLDGPGIELHWSEIFHTLPDRSWGQPRVL
jgi:hypothetical protein